MYIGIVILIKSALSTNVSLASVLQYLNGAQFLNTTCVAALLGVAVIFPVTKIYASESNLEFSLPEPFTKFTVFCVSLIYIIVTEFCENLKEVSFDFSIIKNIVALCVFKILAIKLICCGSFNSICLLKSITNSLYFFFEISKI